jgi:hypothetical protein
MNVRISALLFLMATLLGAPTVAYSVDGRLCQKGVFVNFGNGVWNDFAAAAESRDLLQLRLEAKVIVSRSIERFLTTI